MATTNKQSLNSMLHIYTNYTRYMSGCGDHLSDFFAGGLARIRPPIRAAMANAWAPIRVRIYEHE